MNSPRTGTCRHCLRSRPVFPIGRMGGGTYRRGGRSYQSRICLECVHSLLRYAGSHHAGMRISGFSASTLRNIAAEYPEQDDDQ